MRRRRVATVVGRLAEVLFGGLTGSLVLEGRWGWAGFSAGGLGLVTLYVEGDVREYLLGLRGRALAGLRMVVPVAPLDPELRPDPLDVAARLNTGVAAMCAALEGVGAVDLLLVSGFRLIGYREEKGWLYDALQQHARHTRLRVLLLDPDCDVARQRAQQVMGPQFAWDHYREGVQAVLATFREWERADGMKIEVRLYQEEPIWQMAIVPAELWVMCAARHAATDLSPMFVLKRHEPYGLAWGLEAVWGRRWEHPTTRPLLLAEQREPDWDKIRRVNKPA